MKSTPANGMSSPKEHKRGATCMDHKLKLHPGFMEEIMKSMAEMSGLVLWRVTGTWANKGRSGTIEQIVEAKTATQAIAIAWECEDDRDLRTVKAEWLCTVESVKRND